MGKGGGFGISPFIGSSPFCCLSRAYDALYIRNALIRSCLPLVVIERNLVCRSCRSVSLRCSRCRGSRTNLFDFNYGPQAINACMTCRPRFCGFAVADRTSRFLRQVSESRAGFARGGHIGDVSYILLLSFVRYPRVRCSA